MNLDVHERDIGTELCTSCAACCRIRLKLPNTDSRYRRFLRTVGLEVLPPSEGDRGDCCDEVHDVEVDLGPCRHLETLHTGDRETHRCRLHGTDRLPRLCADYNCVSWAKTLNGYDLGTRNVRSAQVALNSLRERNGAPRE